MRKWIALVLPLLLLIAFPAQAQNNITLDSLKVGLWSEYDQPSMLVIYDFTLSQDINLPVSVDLQIPNSANITAVAFLQGTDLLNAEFTGPITNGQWQTVTFLVKEPTTYHLEYYQPLTRDGEKRSFDYQWLGDYAVNNFRIEAQIPADSTSVKSTPALPFTALAASLSGSASTTNLGAGKGYTLSLSYNRTGDNTITASSAAQVTTEPITPDAPGRVTLDNLPYALGLVGVVLIAGAIYYFWHTNSNQSSGKPRRRNSKNSDDKTQIYCHECGARSNTEDRFCRVCGTKLRNR